MALLRPKRDVVDVVVAKLPPPDRLGKSDGGRDAAYDEDSDQGGEASAIEDFAEALGVRAKNPAAAAAALRDFVSMCIEKHMESASTDEE